MARRTLHGLLTAFAAKYPWYEQQRCCDQEYEHEYDDWTQSDIDELRAYLERPQLATWDVDLYFNNTTVGKLSLSPRAIFDEACDSARSARGMEAGESLSEEERAAPLTEPEIQKALTVVAGIITEALYYSDLVDTFNSEASIGRTLRAGPEGLIDVLGTMYQVEQLASRRTVRAIAAVARANSFQKRMRAAGPKLMRRVELEQPHRLQPMGVTTLALVRAFRRLLDEPLLSDPQPLTYKPCGRPRKVEPPRVRIQLQCARSELRPCHTRLRKAHSASARKAILASFPHVRDRIAACGMLEQIVDGPCPSLEALACEILSRELQISPQTVRRYGRTAAPKSKIRKFTGEQLRG